MKVIKISRDEWNYLKDDGSYLLDEHVFWCCDVDVRGIGFGIVQYKDNKFNLVNSEGKKILKTNVDNCGYCTNRFVEVEINDIWYRIDKECNFYNFDKVLFQTVLFTCLYKKDKIPIQSEISSFKNLYKLFPQKRQELIEIIDKYTYYDVEEYFI